MFCIVAPAGTARDIVQRLSQEIGRVLRQPALRERFAPVGVELSPGTPEEFADIIRGEIPKWGKVMRDAKIAPE